MSVGTYVAGVVGALLSPFFSEDEPNILGAADVEAAINEMSYIRNRLFKVTLGEPQLRNYGGVYRDDWKVVVPATSSDYTDPGNLIFDLPGGPTDPDSYLYVLMNAVGAEEIADIEAKTQESDGQTTTDEM